MLFIGSAGCDLAEREQQAQLREFIDLEALVMSTKGDPSTVTGPVSCGDSARQPFLPWEGIIMLTQQILEPGVFRREPAAPRTSGAE